MRAAAPILDSVTAIAQPGMGYVPRLRWQRGSLDTEGYLIERSWDDGAWHAVAGPHFATVLGPSVLMWTDAGMDSGSAVTRRPDAMWSYRVRAYNRDGLSDRSAALAVAYDGGDGPPPALTAAPTFIPTTPASVPPVFAFVATGRGVARVRLSDGLTIVNIEPTLATASYIARDATGRIFASCDGYLVEIDVDLKVIRRGASDQRLLGAMGIVAHGSYLIVASQRGKIAGGQGGLVVVRKDLTIAGALPDDPAHTGWFGTPQQLSMEGNIAYLYANGGQYLVTVDLADPEHPKTLQALRMPALGEGPLAGDVSGGYAFVSHDHGTLQVYDVSTPARPYIIGMTVAPELYVIRALCRIGTVIYCAGPPIISPSSRLPWGGIVAMDVSDPASPRIGWTLRDDRLLRAHGIVSAAGKLYVSCDGRLTVVDPVDRRVVESFESTLLNGAMWLTIT